MQRDIPATNEIEAYMHCRLCIEQNARPAKIGVGWTKLGLQVWCERHDVNMVHVDFQGQQHPANLDRIPSGTIPGKKGKPS